MNQYYIIEIQQYDSGEYGHIVHFAYDPDATQARLKAEAKYYEVLAAAAVSNLPSHSATLLTCNGYALMNQAYTHKKEVEPESEPIENENNEIQL